MGRAPDAAHPRQHSFGRQGPRQFHPQHHQPHQDGSVRVGPQQEEGREPPEPAWIGPRLGQDEELQREPDERERQAAVLGDEADDGEGQQDGNRGQPTAAGAEGTGVQHGADEAQGPRDDGDDVEGGGAEHLVQRRQDDFGAPLVVDPPAVRLGVAERVQADDRVVGQHPLPGGQLPEDVGEDFAIEGQGDQDADAEDQTEEGDDPRGQGAGRRPGQRRCDRGAGGRRALRRCDFVDRPSRSQFGVHLCSPSDRALRRRTCPKRTAARWENSLLNGCDRGPRRTERGRN